ncbi:MAG: hypothetical protein ABJF23_22825 [Bryobacteraceae bacterium]
MSKFYNLAMGIAVLTSAAAAQPVVSAGGILNAASYSLAGLPNSGIAQGSMFLVFGTGLGPAALVQVSAFPLPNTLSGTSIKVTVNGITLDVPMVYTLASQICGILPSNTPIGTGSLTVTYNNQTSAAVSFKVVKTAVGIFAVNQQGNGPGVLQNVNTETDRPVNTVINSAKPGQAMILWAVGLGPITGSDAAGVFPGPLDVDAQVWVGNKQANIIYKGRSGCCSGIDQIVFTVPDDAAEACHVPVVVKTGDVVSNYVSMAIARRGGACDADTAAIQVAGAVRAGQVSLTRVATDVTLFGLTGTFISDSTSGSFGRYDLARYTASQGSYEVGYCTSYLFKGTDYLGSADPVAPDVLDAGAALNITGPKGTKRVNKGTDGGYSQQLAGSPLPGGISAGPDYLEAGTYTVDNGTGGTGANAVGPFKATLTLPPVLKWENKASINVIDRTQNLEVTWSGGDPNGFVNIVGGSALSTFGAAFVCREKTSAGRFTIPSLALLNVPLGDLSVLSVGGISSAKFTATGLDSAALTSYQNSAKTVTFR